MSGEPREQSGRDRRVSPRAPVPRALQEESRVELHCGDGEVVASGRLLDISEQGVGVLVPETRPKGEMQRLLGHVCELRLVLPELVNLQVGAMPRYASVDAASRYRVGFQLLVESEDQTRSLRAAVAALLGGSPEK